jgi:hypothetical protein
VKDDASLPRHAYRWCLARAGLSTADVDGRELGELLGWEGRVECVPHHPLRGRACSTQSTVL